MLEISLNGKVDEQIDLIAHLIMCVPLPGSILFTTPTEKTSDHLLTLIRRRYPDSFGLVNSKSEPLCNGCHISSGFLFDRRLTVKPNEKSRGSKNRVRSCCYSMAVVLMSENTCPEMMDNLRVACHFGRMVMMSWEPGVL